MSVTLKASFRPTEDKGLTVRARIENAGDADILVLDRLWTLDASSKPVLDGERIYRFERSGSLRLLLGAAPLPRLKHALYRNVPLATRVPARSALEREITIPGPLREYSVYFPEVDPARWEPNRVTRAYLVVDYLEAKPEIVTHPSTLDPTALDIEKPVFALAGAKRLVGDAEVGPIEVLRRTDELDRLQLPGEAPEPLQLA